MPISQRQGLCEYAGNGAQHTKMITVHNTLVFGALSLPLLSSRRQQSGRYKCTCIAAGGRELPPMRVMMSSLSVSVLSLSVSAVTCSGWGCLPSLSALGTTPSRE